MKSAGPQGIVQIKDSNKSKSPKINEKSTKSRTITWVVDAYHVYMFHPNVEIKGQRKQLGTKTPRKFSKVRNIVPCLISYTGCAPYTPFSLLALFTNHNWTRSTP